jgi:hypothetical protein
MRCKICSKTFRTPPPRMRDTQVCTECQSFQDITNSKNNTKFYSNTGDMENVAVEDIDISRGQAEFLKSIMKHIRIGELTAIKLRQLLHKSSDMKYFVNENWGDEEHFINLALNEKDSNQISQILYFLNIKNKIGRVPTKQDMKELSVIDISEYEKNFRAWENFLDLLGFDPWYKNNNSDSTKKLKKIRRIGANKSRIDDNEQEKSSLFLKNDTIEETIKKINELRLIIKEKYKQKDSEENYSDYSYTEMFDLLEKYIDIMPNKAKYSNIKDLS